MAATKVPSAVVVDPAQLTLVAGTDGVLAAQVNNAAGNPIGGAVLKFAVMDASLLQVSDTGRVTALGPATSQTFVRVVSGPREARVPVSVKPGPAHRLTAAIDSAGQAQQAGVAPEAPLNVQLADAWGNALAGVTLVAESKSIDVPLQVVTDAQGVARIPLPSLERAGPVELNIHPLDVSEPFTVARLLVHAGPAAKLEASIVSRTEVPPSAAPVPNSGAENSATARATAEPADTVEAPIDIAIQILDAFGNGVPDVELSVVMAGDTSARKPLRTDASGQASAALPQPESYGKFPIEVRTTTAPALQQMLAFERSKRAQSRKR